MNASKVDILTNDNEFRAIKNSDRLCCCKEYSTYKEAKIAKKMYEKEYQNDVFVIAQVTLTIKNRLIIWINFFVKHMRKK